MPGLLDQFSSLSNPTQEDLQKARSMGLLAAGLGLLSGSAGQGYRPSFGQALGQGGMQGMAAYNQILAQAPQQRLQSALTGAKLIEIEDQVKARKSQEALAGQFTDPAARLLAGAGDFKGAVSRQFPQQEGFTLSPGAIRYDASGKAIAQAPTAPPEFLRALEAAGVPQGSETWNKAVGAWIGKQATHAPPVSVQNFPAPVPVLDPSTGQPTLVQFGNRGEIRPTGLRPPVSAEERKVKMEEEKSEKRAEAALARADIVSNTIDKALGQVGFFTTGATGTALGAIPGTSAYNLDKTIDTIKANIGFQELHQMREASPTGGALGQVAVQELNMLQSVLGSLDKGQSEGQLRANLQQAKQHFENWKNAVLQSQGQTQPSTPSAPQKGEVRSGYVFLGGDPSNRMNWRKQQ